MNLPIIGWWHEIVHFNNVIAKLPLGRLPRNVVWLVVSVVDRGWKTIKLKHILGSKPLFQLGGSG